MLCDQTDGFDAVFSILLCNGLLAGRVLAKIVVPTVRNSVAPVSEPVETLAQGILICFRADCYAVENIVIANELEGFGYLASPLKRAFLEVIPKRLLNPIQ